LDESVAEVLPPCFSNLLTVIPSYPLSDRAPCIWTFLTSLQEGASGFRIKIQDEQPSGTLHATSLNVKENPPFLPL
jgi:hypothetical protein